MKRRKTTMYRYMETWKTRYGKSQRVVTRDANGRFVDQVSLSAIR